MLDLFIAPIMGAAATVVDGIYQPHRGRESGRDDGLSGDLDQPHRELVGRAELHPFRAPLDRQDSRCGKGTSPQTLHKQLKKLFRVPTRPDCVGFVLCICVD